MVGVFVNGGRVEAPTGTSVLDVLRMIGAPYREGCKVTVLRRVKLPSPASRDYSIETNKGKIVVNVEESFFPLWLKHFQLLDGVGMGWSTGNVVAFGPVDFSSLGLRPAREKLRFARFDLFLSFGGFDPSQAFLVLSKVPHEGIYGVPEEYPIIGRVVSGGHLITELEKGDRILAVKPLITEKKELVTGKLGDIKVEEGMEIYTFVEVALNLEARVCAEHFLGVVREGTFNVDRVATSFISSGAAVGVGLPSENTVYRARGTVTVRNSGNGVGAIYIYRRDSPFVTSHSVVGKVIRGIEIVDHAESRDRFLIKTIPERLMVVGMTQGEASEYLARWGIKHVRVNDESDDAVVIEQRPKFTMDVKEQGVAVTLGVDPESVVQIELWEDEAPVSTSHFKSVAEMTMSNVGKLQVIATTDEVLLLSSTSAKTFKSIPPENPPSVEVEEGSVGVTNSFRKLTGVIGVRLKPSKSYGPTGEAFEGTNLIGRVVKGLDSLKNRKVGDVIYFMKR